MSTFYLKDVNSRGVYHPTFQLVKIDGNLPESPKVGDYIDQWVLETMVYNGCRIVIEPRDGV